MAIVPESTQALSTLFHALLLDRERLFERPFKPSRGHQEQLAQPSGHVHQCQLGRHASICYVLRGRSPKQSDRATESSHAQRHREAQPIEDGFCLGPARRGETRNSRCIFKM